MTRSVNYVTKTLNMLLANRIYAESQAVTATKLTRTPRSRLGLGLLAGKLANVCVPIAEKIGAP